MKASRRSSSKPTSRLTVFYDGACALCRRQASFWGRLDKQGAIDWRDISQDARELLGTGISHRQALGQLHARTAEGKVLDRKSTRLNSSHVRISYAVFCLKKK